MNIIIFKNQSESKSKTEYLKSISNSVDLKVWIQ